MSSISSPLQQQGPLEINLAYDPLPKQAEFHGQDGKYRLFIGGVGNGKTSSGCAEAFFLAMEYPGSVGLIGRATRPELHATTQKTFFEGGGGDANRGDWTGCPPELIKKFNKTRNELTLINGSMILFWPLDEPDKFTNLNLGWFLIDQAEEVPEDIFLMLVARLRQRNAPRKGILLANPNGHDWLWRRWINLTYPYHTYVHAKTTDNPHLPKDYVDALYSSYPKAWRERFIEGSFEVFTGQIWPEFNPDVHVIAPFPIPYWYEVIETIDHGRRNPTAVLWLAFDEKGNCFIIDEHYEAGQRVGHHAKKILEKRATNGYPVPNYTVIDASAAQKDPNTERSVMDEYYDHGIRTIPSDRHKIARINRVAEWLTLDKDHEHPISGETCEDGYPHLYIFRNCVNLIEHVPQYKWKPQSVSQTEDAKEEPLKKDDHDVDSMGYGLMTRPRPSNKPTAHHDSSARTQQYWKRHHDKMRGGSGHSKYGSEM